MATGRKKKKKKKKIKPIIFNFDENGEELIKDEDLRI
jgi:hypothetical protein